LVNVAINSSLDAGAERVAGAMYFGSYKIDVGTGSGFTGSFDSSYYRLTIRSFVDNESSGQGTGSGFTGSFDSSYYRLTIRSFVDNESSGQDIVVGRSLTGLDKKFAEAGKNAGKLAKMAVGGKQGKAGKYDVIMSPTVAANILGQITDGANPLLMLMGMSPLGDDVNGYEPSWRSFWRANCTCKIRCC